MCFTLMMDALLVSNTLLEHNALCNLPAKMILDPIFEASSVASVKSDAMEICQTEQQVSLIEMLPNEMRSEIFTKLIEAKDWKTLCRACEVSWSWKIEIERLWRNYCVHNQFVTDEKIWEKKGKNWKWVCAALTKIFEKDEQKEGFGCCPKSSYGPVEIRYEGEWKDNKKNGVGRIWWSNGDRYLGDWVNDAKEGYGYMLWENGDCYEGDWKKDLREGTQCTYTYSNGGTFIGTYSNDERHGEGAFVWPDGERFVGQWKSGGRFGKGVLYTKNGPVEQEWEESPFVNYSEGLPSKYPASRNAGSSS